MSEIVSIFCHYVCEARIVSTSFLVDRCEDYLQSSKRFVTIKYK
jgi:hypothetical protein